MVVFVHGLLGDREESWANQNESFPVLLASDTEFKERVDIFAFEYFSPTFRGGAPSIPSLAEQLSGSLDDHRIFKDHEYVVFLSHSMGGLVVRRFIVSKRDRISKIKMLYFFATPTFGADLAKSAKHISSNPQLRGLLPLEQNDLLTSIQQDWQGWNEAKKIPSYCAYEILETYGKKVVSQESATALCNMPFDPISQNHIDIVKPKNRESVSYRRFTNALRVTMEEIDNNKNEYISETYTIKPHMPIQRPLSRIADIEWKYNITNPENRLISCMMKVHNEEIITIMEQSSDGELTAAKINILSDITSNRCGSSKKEQIIHGPLEGKEVIAKRNSAGIWVQQQFDGITEEQKNDLQYGVFIDPFSGFPKNKIPVGEVITYKNDELSLLMGNLMPGHKEGSASTKFEGVIKENGLFAKLSHSLDVTINTLDNKNQPIKFKMSLNGGGILNIADTEKINLKTNLTGTMTKYNITPKNSEYTGYLTIKSVLNEM